MKWTSLKKTTDEQTQYTGRCEIKVSIISVGGGDKNQLPHQATLLCPTKCDTMGLLGVTRLRDDLATSSGGVTRPYSKQSRLFALPPSAGVPASATQLPPELIPASITPAKQTQTRSPLLHTYIVNDRRITSPHSQPMQNRREINAIWHKHHASGIHEKPSTRSSPRHSLAVGVLHFKQHLILSTDGLDRFVIQVCRVEPEEGLLPSRTAGPDQPLVLLRQGGAATEVRSCHRRSGHDRRSQGRTEQRQGRVGQGGAERGRAGQGRAGRGGTGQDRTGQGIYQVGHLPFERRRGNEGQARSGPMKLRSVKTISCRQSMFKTSKHPQDWPNKCNPSPQRDNTHIISDTT